MKPDPFEEKLRRQPLRSTPPEWRAQILHAALAAEPGSRLSPLDPRPSPWWRELLWPCPQAWAALAAVWLAVFVFQRTVGEPARLAARPMVPLSPEVLTVLREQRRLLAELIDSSFPQPAEPPKPSIPRPRSEFKVSSVLV